MFWFRGAWGPPNVTSPYTVFGLYLTEKSLPLFVPVFFGFGSFAAFFSTEGVVPGPDGCMMQRMLLGIVFFVFAGVLLVLQPLRSTMWNFLMAAQIILSGVGVLLPDVTALLDARALVGIFTTLYLVTLWCIEHRYKYAQLFPHDEEENYIMLNKILTRGHGVCAQGSSTEEPWVRAQSPPVHL